MKVKLSVTLDEDLVRQVDSAAKAERSNRSAILEQLLKHGLQCGGLSPLPMGSCITVTYWRGGCVIKRSAAPPLNNR